MDGELLPFDDLLERRAKRYIQLLVIHCTELPTLEDARNAALDSWSEACPQRATCGHYYIDRDGTIHQFVGDDRVVRHASDAFNYRSIGIELVNLGRYPNWFSSQDQLPSDPYTDAQIVATVELIRQLESRYESIDRLARHSDLDARLVPAQDNAAILVRRRIDPGPLFPWERVVLSVRSQPTDRIGEDLGDMPDR